VDFFPHKDLSKRKSAIDDNRKAIDEAAELGTKMLVLVCGADPLNRWKTQENRFVMESLPSFRWHQQQV
jgi:sugar phosphate isomerase/epimerase